MSVSKSWAYVTEFGRETVTAWTIMREREKHGGKPLGKTYWSNRKPGERKLVKQVQKVGTTFWRCRNPSGLVQRAWLLAAFNALSSTGLIGAARCGFACGADRHVVIIRQRLLLSSTTATLMPQPSRSDSSLSVAG
ncbi:hypothetical protein P5W99_00750 [Paraburkholderia sp. A3BS-1L]|uniref:hypothetical protein n=1 Tax=Paraburkholderia sp. A3BS-1L TaxID=3028375 RepID=UPI003DA7D268